MADRSRAGEPVIGWKVGCTSSAISRQFGLQQSMPGSLFERELESDGAESCSKTRFGKFRNPPRVTLPPEPALFPWSPDLRRPLTRIARPWDNPMERIREPIRGA